MIKKCVICGRDFYSPPSAKTVTCSPACRSERARRAASRKRPEEVKAKISATAKGRDMSAIQGRGTEAAKNSPLAGRFETNSSAKTYTLVSPEGVKVEVTNLRQWARENSEFFGFDPTDENVQRICNGFYTIAKNIRLCRRGQTYKGWTIIVTDRRKNCEKKEQE